MRRCRRVMHAGAATSRFRFIVALVVNDECEDCHTLREQPRQSSFINRSDVGSAPTSPASLVHPPSTSKRSFGSKSGAPAATALQVLVTSFGILTLLALADIVGFARLAAWLALPEPLTPRSATADVEAAIDWASLAQGEPLNASSPVTTARAWAVFQRVSACWTHAGSWQTDETRPANSTPDDRDRERYFWVPDGDCLQYPLVDFNRSAFCALLRGRPIQVIGDSMSLHFYYALQKKTRPKGDIEPTFGREGAVGYGFRNESAICHDSAFGRSLALLYQTRRMFEETRGKDREGAISVGRYLNLTVEAGIRPSILILIRGMHASSHADILEDVRLVMRRIRASHPNALVIWRSTPCPHPWCTNYSRPIASPLPFEDLKLGHGVNSQGDPISYGWHPVCQQVPLVKAMLESEFPGVIYMDTTTPMALRPDSHLSPSDCVHYSHSRYMDIWMQLLYNLLLLLDRLPPPPGAASLSTPAPQAS